MHIINISPAVGIAFLAVLTNASPVSSSIDSMSKDWRPAFASGMSMASSIDSGTSMASIALLGADSATTVRGEVWNSCPFAIWVRQAVAAYSSGPTSQECEHFGETQMVKLPSMTKYVARYKAKMDQCGHVLKVARNSAQDLNVYQVEYSLDPQSKRMWYNLSGEDGAPFQDQERYLTGLGPSGTCPFVACDSGEWGKDPEHGCDWPLQPVCESIGPVVAIMCGKMEGNGDNSGESDDWPVIYG
ncbi:hypothetical protein EJ02DRAFT_458153 [Clathrospora elynae]|uniref:Uncharacterized protein n=1 Tax=Clathrospora elynae TaxID=706981 RepID=A0A6A5SBZ1_9PLEO|nr:hypothetical protein EJ02DRAFT_458153 [Clathrospora elynae]